MQRPRVYTRWTTQRLQTLVAQGETVGRRRRALFWLSAPLLLLAVAWIALKCAVAFDAPDEFRRQKGNLAAVELEPVGGDSLYQSFAAVLVSDAGYRVRGHLRVPVEEGIWPAIIVLAGVRTGRMAAELIEPDSPYIILGLDYPWDGPTRLTAWQFLTRLFAIRRAMLLTPSATMLGIDYLEGRPDVDTAAIVLAGASFGGQLATVAGAVDTRASAVLVVFGGGDYAELLRANLKVKPSWLRSLLARAGAWLLTPLEPLEYAGSISPRPVILINGSRDTSIPRESVVALYEAAREPRRLIWLDEGHIRPRNTELIRRVLRAAYEALIAVEEQRRQEVP